MKLKQELSEKERLRDNFKQRLEMNNIHWEENLVCRTTSDPVVVDFLHSLIMLISNFEVYIKILCFLSAFHKSAKC